MRAELAEVGLRPATFVDGTGYTTDAPPDILFAALEKTRMPMVVTDPALPDNPIVFVNRAFVDLSGYPPEEIVGRNCRFLQGPSTDLENVAKIKEAINGRRMIATVVENHRKDSTTFQNELYISPVFSRDGKLMYFSAARSTSPGSRPPSACSARAKRATSQSSTAHAPSPSSLPTHPAS